MCDLDGIRDLRYVFEALHVETPSLLKAREHVFEYFSKSAAYHELTPGNLLFDWKIEDDTGEKGQEKGKGSEFTRKVVFQQKVRHLHSGCLVFMQGSLY